MLPIFNVIVPVFALMATGYLAVRFRLYPAAGVSGLVYFVNNFATPCLLFQAMLGADFSTAFNPSVIGSFYIGALACFALGIILARTVFRRAPGESVASGFSAMFSNTVMVGIPILNRAYGDAAMPVVYSIIGFHAPLLLTVGSLIMELMRRDGASLGKTLQTAGVRIIMNPLMWGVFLGLGANRLGVVLPEPATAFVAMMAAAVLPTALFGLGGALNEYKLSQSWRQAAAMSVLKLVLQPLIAWVLMIHVFHVDPALARYGVLLAAMPAGINVYVFASYYNRSLDVATNAVLLSTAAAMVTVSVWIAVLGIYS